MSPSNDDRESSFTFILPTRGNFLADTDGSTAFNKVGSTALSTPCDKVDADHYQICRGCDRDIIITTELALHSFGFYLTGDNDIQPLCSDRMHSFRDTKQTATSSSHTSSRRKFYVEIPHCKGSQQCRLSALNWFDQYMLKNGVGDA